MFRNLQRTQNNDRSFSLFFQKFLVRQRNPNFSCCSKHFQLQILSMIFRNKTLKTLCVKKERVIYHTAAKFSFFQLKLDPENEKTRFRQKNSTQISVSIGMLPLQILPLQIYASSILKAQGPTICSVHLQMAILQSARINLCSKKLAFALFTFLCSCRLRRIALETCGLLCLLFLWLRILKRILRGDFKIVYILKEMC